MLAPRKDSYLTITNGVKSLLAHGNIHLNQTLATLRPWKGKGKGKNLLR